MASYMQLQHQSWIVRYEDSLRHSTDNTTVDDASARLEHTSDRREPIPEVVASTILHAPTTALGRLWALKK